MLPQAAWGSSTPKFKKLSPASAKMVLPKFEVVVMIRGEIQLGRM